MSSPDEPAAVTLDVWYTLLYQTAAERRAYEAARRAAWTVPLEAAGVEPARAEAAVTSLVREAKRREALGHSFTVRDQGRWLARRLAVSFDARSASRALDRAVDSVACEVAPGALEMIDRLRGAGTRLALVSNILYENPRPVRRLLRRVGLVPTIPVTVLSCEVGSAKPSPRPIAIALERLRVPPAGTLHIGDRPGDIESAWRAGAGAAHFSGLRRFWPAAHGRTIPPPWDRAPVLNAWRRLTARSVGPLWRNARAALPPASGLPSYGSA